VITPTSPQQASRQARCYEKALEILPEMRKGGLYQCFDNHDGSYLIVKQAYTNRVSDNSNYVVNLLTETCTCPDWQNHRDFCKHLIGVEIMLAAIDYDEGLEKMLSDFDSAECSTGCDAHYWIDR